jgi:hypothetical protein
MIKQKFIPQVKNKGRIGVDFQPLIKPGITGKNKLFLFRQLAEIPSLRS